jgi:hypothetical protein
MLLLLVSLLNVAVFSAVAHFPTSCSGGPTADDIHDVPIVPSAAVISDFNSFPDVVDLPACWLHYFCKHPSFAGVHSVLAVLLLLLFLLLLVFLLL